MTCCTRGNDNARAWIISAAKCALVFLEASQSNQIIPLPGVKTRSQEHLRALLKLSRRNSMFPPRAFPELQQARVGYRTQSTISSLKDKTWIRLLYSFAERTNTASDCSLLESESGADVGGYKTEPINHLTRAFVMHCHFPPP